MTDADRLALAGALDLEADRWINRTLFARRMWLRLCADLHRAAVRP